MISHSMCIGALCEGMLLGNCLGTRVQGPVDNFEAYNIASTMSLFNNELLDDLMSDNILYKEKNIFYTDREDDDNLRFYTHNDYNINNWGWKTVHTNFENENRKLNFLNRYQAFKKFNEAVKNNKKGYVYFYTISCYDNELTETDLDDILNMMPKFVVDNIIIISGVRNNIPKIFEDRLRCLYFNANLSGDPNANYTGSDKWEYLNSKLYPYQKEPI